VVIPNITHYGIYYEAHQQAQKLALEWFDKYLKPRRSSWGRPPGLDSVGINRREVVNERVMQERSSEPS
jgi:hypothetical protein